MPATIAIVGRANVGKSTLFNRLTGTRAALVSDLPGLTRDRKEGEAEIGGHQVTLIDTAGLEASAPGSIAARMRSQSETAIAKSDLVLFVVDARAGITPADKVFAETARASGKPIILVANKCEGRGGEEGFYDAFRLGLGEPIAISAEHGEGIADLEADMLAALGLSAVQRSRRRREESEPEADETRLPSPSWGGVGGGGTPDDAVEDQTGPRSAISPSPTLPHKGGGRADAARPIRVAIVGRPNSGKSTLVNALIGEERMITGPEPGLTRDAVATDLDWNGRAIRLFDTAGLRRKARISETAEKLAASDAVRAIRFAEVVVLLVDAERPFEHQDLTIGDLVVEEGRALVVAVNKWDLVADKQKRLRELKAALAMGLSQAPGVPLVAISALAERGLDRLMDAVLDTFVLWNRRIGTAELNRWLGEALSRHAPPAAKGRRIKLRFMTQPSTRPPTFVVFCSQPAALPKDYVRYLTNSLRDAFGLPGVPIRFNLRKGDNPYAR